MLQLLQPHDTTAHPALASEGTAAIIAASPKKTQPQPPSVNQWIRSAIRDSLQRTTPIGFLY